MERRPCHFGAMKPSRHAIGGDRCGDSGKRTPPMSKIVRRFRDIAARARPPAAENLAYLPAFRPGCNPVASPQNASMIPFSPRRAQVAQRAMERASW